MPEQALFEPYSLGNLTLTHRTVMASLTHNRASAELVITEATHISA
ncbi:hypothetical protein [Pseudomonas kitaguniensis]